MIEPRSKLQGTQTLEAVEALLIYRQGRAAAVVSSHPASVTDGKIEVGPGSCLTRDAVIEIWKGLVRASSGREILPEHVLYVDGSRVLWYRPANRRPVFFHTGRREFDDELRGRQALFPPLLFLATAGRLHVWGLGGDRRPGPDVPLYQAPFLNIYATGAMCAGTAKLPLEVSTDVALWEKAFFETTFTHSNLRDKLTLHPGGHDGLWRELAGEVQRPRWQKWLKPLKGFDVRAALNLEVKER